MGRKRIAVGVIPALLLLMATSGGTAAAQVPGARFVYETCDPTLTAGNPPPFTFKNPNGGGMEVVADCAVPGGALGILETGGANGDPSWIEIGVPETPGGFVETETITALGVDWAEGNGPSHVYTDGFPPPDGREWTQTFPQHSQRELFFGSGGSFDMALDCNAGQACNTGAGVYVHYIAATEVDPTPPVVAPPSGTLLAGGVLRGHQTISTQATDVGGGVSAVSVLVNGMPGAPAVAGTCAVGSVDNRSVFGTVALSPTPCPPALPAAWTLDTSAYPFHDGSNTVSVCASDLATVGLPNTTCTPPRTVEVDNSCTESPVAGGEDLSAQIGGSGGEEVTVGYGSEAQVTGSLTDAGGQPVAGATICVKSATIGLEPTPQPVGTAKTDSGGQFTYQVPPGPDRELVLGYRHDSFQVGRSVRYLAHAKPTLAADRTKMRNGAQVKLYGSLPQPEAAARVVVLQANVVGSKRWITFRRAATGPKGNFGAAYRFHATTRKTHYRFRAVVPTQDHYPYVEGHSEPVTVTVRPDRRGHHPGRRHPHAEGGKK
jgi:hypothetical protein